MTNSDAADLADMARRIGDMEREARDRKLGALAFILGMAGCEVADILGAAERDPLAFALVGLEVIEGGLIHRQN